ncbi:MAG: PDZ domain-containing protein, partial [Desulfobacterales bacterium]
LVSSVFPDDPADQAGVRENDIILAVNGKNIKDSRELTSLIANIVVGDIVKLKVSRAGKTKTYKVTIGLREEDKLASRDSPGKRGTQLGIRVSEMTPSIARRFNLSDTEGVIVSRVQPGGKGAEAGIQSGDIIKEINHTSIDSVADYDAVIRGVEKGQPILMYIQRANRGNLVIKLVK